MKPVCPACGRGVFNRRLPRCEFCDAPLPAELVMSADEIRAADQALAESAARAREKRRLEAEERRRRAREAYLFGPQGPFFPGGA